MERTVGPYEIVRPLGTGGMGEVFLGRDPRLQRPVALKRLIASDDARGRVLREARAAARLSHPHIAAVYDVLDLPTGAFIVMEYVEGETLAARIARGPLPPDEVVGIGRQLASAVAAAHDGGVVHRDLKPANIQLTRGGSAKILDFGVARLSPPVTPPVEASAATQDPTMTVTGAAHAGTPAYMAPEQLLGRGADERSDVYSLGAVLYEMATGVRPYRGRDPLTLAGEMAAGGPPAAQAVNPSVPRWLSDVIARALERDRSARFRSAGALEAALDPASCAPAADVAAAPATDSKRVWAWRGVALTAIVAALAVPAAWRARGNRIGSASRAPVVLAILPVDNPTGDPQAEYLGTGITSVIRSNFGAIAGLTLASRSATAQYQTERGDLTALQRDTGATLVLDLRLTSTVPRTEIAVRLRKPGVPAPVWEETVGGDALTAEKALLDGLSHALERVGLMRALSAAERARVERVPTTSADALVAYSKARALLQPSNSPDAPSKAIELLQGAVKQDPRFVLAYAALADAYWAQYQHQQDPGLVTKATDAVDAALRIDPDQGPVYASLAVMYQRTGRYEDAVKALRRAIELQPDSDENHRVLARVFADRGDFASAVAEADRAIAIRADWTNYRNLGYVQYRAGHYPAALDAYRRTTELNPTYAAGFQALGTVYQVMGDLPQAIGNYEHAVRLSPNVPEAFNNLALAYYTSRRFDDALRTWQSALALRPTSALYYRNIADTYRRLGNPAAARGAYESAIRLGRQVLTVNPRDADALGFVAVCEARLGRRDDAERHANELIAVAPGNYNAWLHSAQAHAILRQPDAALRDLAAAIAHGYSKQMARTDDDLQPLRRLSAFEILVADAPATPTKR